jgi:hypothetical protein
MLKGRYQYGGFRNTKNHFRWVTLSAAPDVQRKDVVIDSVSAYFWECWIHLKNVTLNQRLRGKGQARLWMDGVDYFNPKGYVEAWSDTRFNGGEWYTDCVIHDLHLGGASGLIRNTDFNKIGEDSIRGAHTLINV